MSSDDLTVMSTQNCSTLPDCIIQAPLPIFYALFEGDVLAMVPTDQQANCISNAPSIRAFLQPLTHTPPPR